MKNSSLSFDSPDDTPPINSTLRRVEYLDLDDFELQDRILSDCLEELRKYRDQREAAASDVPDYGSFGFDDEFVLRWEIGQRSCLVKHSGFKSEQEIRLIAPPLFLSGASVKFRCPRTTVIPYVEVLMPKRKVEPLRSIESIVGQRFDKYYDDYFIDSVLIGPTPNPDLTVKAIQLLFESRAVRVTVLESDIPYRDL